MSPRGGDDLIFTPDDVALKIVRHFRPRGRILEPCRGGGAFTRLLPDCDWCEITEGRDFLTMELPDYDWVVTNPPYSLFREFLLRSMAVADNIVFLAHLNVWMTKSRLNALKQQDFGLVETLLFPTPPAPWRQTGFQLGATWIRKGWKGGWHIAP